MTERAVNLPSLATASAWEAAYLRFETPAHERRKFIHRLDWLGAPSWQRSSDIVELFCGRGNGLRALSDLGFTRLTGVDLSPRLLALCPPSFARLQADCRALPLASSSRDIAIVQGGLHHLDSLPGDLDQVLLEARRVLRPNGLLALVEPWSTPFLRLAHAGCRSPMRHLWSKLDAMADMIHHERRTYEQWLASPTPILQSLDQHFTCRKRAIAWGKLMYVGQPRPSAAAPAPRTAAQRSQSRD